MPESFPFTRARWQRERNAHEAHRQPLMACVVAVVREVLGGEGVEAAYVVGSLAVPGAHGRALHRRAGDAPGATGTEHVDLIELERVPFREALERRGHRVL